jgi:hypothetical protein
VNGSRVQSPSRRSSERTPAAAELTARRRWKPSPDRRSFRRRTEREPYRRPALLPFSPSPVDSFSGPFAVRRLGRFCAAEGLFANRCLSEAIADVRASPRDDPSGPSDSRPRRGAGPSAAARPARRLFPSPFWPVKKGTSRPDHYTEKKHPYGTFVEPTPKRPEPIRPARPNEPGAPRQPVRSSATPSTTHSPRGQDRRRSGCLGPR